MICKEGLARHRTRTRLLRVRMQVGPVTKQRPSVYSWITGLRAIGVRHLNAATSRRCNTSEQNMKQRYADPTHHNRGTKQTINYERALDILSIPSRKQLIDLRIRSLECRTCGIETCKATVPKRGGALISEATACLQFPDVCNCC
jgi:hypothetical protein